MENQKPEPKQEANNLNISSEDISKFAKEHLQAYKNEVLVLKSIVNAKSSSALPNAIHDLCVIAPNEGYRFFEPVRKLFASIDLRTNRDEKTKEGVRMTIANLNKLIAEEKTAYKNQAQLLIISAHKQGREYNLKEESKWFEHVQYNTAPMVYQFSKMYLMGELLLTSEQTDILADLQKLVHNIATEYLELREKAVHNCEILSK